MFRLSNPFSGWFVAKEFRPDPIIRPVEVHSIQEDKDKRSRRLIHLLRANHINHCVLYHDLEYHNHMPHILGSAYIFGADPQQLSDIYDAEAKELESWKDSPGEILRRSWRSHFGDGTYQRAYLDFFEDEVVRYNYDWKQVLMDYLLQGDSPLLNGLISGLGHPLIHMGYAIELDNRELAMEALTQASCSYSNLHRYVDGSSYPLPFDATTKPLEIIHRIRNDERFHHVVPHPGYDYNKLLDERGPQVLQYFNTLILEELSLASIYEALVDTAILIHVTGQKKENPKYDFFLVHLVTTAHALRVILPLLSLAHAKSLIRSHWVLVVLTYFTQMRPLVKEEMIRDYSVVGRSWDDVSNVALTGKHNHDSHFVKALRAFKEFDTLFGSKDGFYLRAALKMADEFDGWSFDLPNLDVQE